MEKLRLSELISESYDMTCKRNQDLQQIVSLDPHLMFPGEDLVNENTFIFAGFNFERIDAKVIISRISGIHTFKMG